MLLGILLLWIGVITRYLLPMLWGKKDAT